MSESSKWTPKRILCEIHERGMTLEQLARRHGRNPNSFRHIWKRPNTINEAIVASFIGCSAEELWPDRYPKNSSRVFDSKKWGPVDSQKPRSAVDNARSVA
ncbi:helix-turn-helix domain-containing protein [Shinella sp. BYT-45]|uniref:helix-turn-helix domain-containing protein n=1 Tax=Shinella sp. BYT-45 TaxID=3377377 RepID=UPI00397FDFD7